MANFTFFYCKRQPKYIYVTDHKLFHPGIVSIFSIGIANFLSRRLISIYHWQQKSFLGIVSLFENGNLWQVSAWILAIKHMKDSLGYDAINITKAQPGLSWWLSLKKCHGAGLVWALWRRLQFKTVTIYSSTWHQR